MDAIPVKYSLLTLSPAFYPIPSARPLSWNAFNLRKIWCLWQSLPSLVITALQVLYGNIQSFQCLSQPSTVSGSYSTVGKHFWDDSAPSHAVSLWWLQLPTMTMSCSIRHRTSQGGTANPPGAYCGTRFIGCCQGITTRRRVRIRCAVYLLVKGQTAWGLGSFLAKGSICLVQSEIHTQRERKSKWLQRHDLDGAGTRMIHVFFDGALDALRGEQISSLDHRHIYGRLTLSRLPLKPIEK